MKREESRQRQRMRDPDFDKKEASRKATANVASKMKREAKAADTRYGVVDCVFVYHTRLYSRYSTQ